jgi:long-chain fatty acid transport protein
MGSSYAGAGATALDASTAYLNPAGMTRLGQSQMLLGAYGSFVDLQFSVDANDTISVPPGESEGGGQIGGFLPGMGTYLVFGLTEDLKLGFSLNVPYAGKVDYENDWVGRRLITEALFLVLNIEPSIALRVTDWLSIGAGLNVYYLVLNQEFEVPIGPFRATFGVEDADDWAVGYTPSILLEPREGTRIGIVYRSEADVDLSGSFRNPTALAINFDADFELPQGINASLYQQLTPKLALLADGGWTDWSTSSQGATTVGAVTTPGTRNWRDTWRAALGFQYQIDEQWLVQSGFSYDSSPVRGADRLLPDLPVFEAYRMSAGVQYDLDASHTIGLSYTYVDFGDGDVERVALPPLGRVVLDGEYDPNSAHFVGATLIIRFGTDTKRTKQ